jgi:hypothetical protein
VGTAAAGVEVNSTGTIVGVLGIVGVSVGVAGTAVGETSGVAVADGEDTRVGLADGNGLGGSEGEGAVAWTIVVGGSCSWPVQPPNIVMRIIVPARLIKQRHSGVRLKRLPIRTIAILQTA